MKFLFPFTVFLLTAGTLSAQKNWNKTFGDRLMGATGIAVASDAKGNSYFLGNFKGSFSFTDNGINYQATSNDKSLDIYLIKKDSTDRVIWLKHWGGTYYDRATGMQTDPKGAIMITGDFGGTTDLEPGPGVKAFTVPEGKSSSFILKLNEQGEFIWARQITSTNTIYTRAIATNKNQEVFITGNFSGEIVAGNTTQPATINNPKNFKDLFVLKLNGNGETAWAKHFAGTGEEQSLGIAADNKGGVAICGFFSGMLTMGGTGLVRTYVSTTGTSEYDGFVASLNANGNAIWVKQFGSNTSNNEFTETLNAVAIDANDDVIVTGGYQQTINYTPNGKPATAVTSNGKADILISKLSSTGKIIWAKSYGGVGNDAGHAIAVGPENSLLVTGVFEGKYDFETNGTKNELVSAGGKDMFFMFFDTDGTCQGTRKGFGKDNDIGYGITISSRNEILITGNAHENDNENSGFGFIMSLIF